MSNDFDELPSTSVTGAVETTEPRRCECCLVVMSGALLGHVEKLPTDALVVGRAPLGGLAIDDHGVSRQHVRFERHADGTVELVDLDSTNGTYCNGERVTRRILQDGDRIRLGGSTVLKFTLQDAVESKFHQTQFDAARRDGLTGCHNKRYLLEHLKVELSFARRHRRILTLAMLDLDHFKQVNDCHGHLAGDAVLQALVEVVLRSIRAEDVLARYGGEEFVLVMRETEPEQAAIVAERLRSQVQQAPISFEGRRISVTVSIGVAAGPSDRVDTPEALLDLADQALYQAKNSGRNRVVVSSAP